MKKELTEAEELLEHIVKEFDKWNSDPKLQRQGSLEWWLKEEIKYAREYLEGIVKNA